MRWERVGVKILEMKEKNMTEDLLKEGTIRFSKQDQRYALLINRARYENNTIFSGDKKDI